MTIPPLVSLSITFSILFIFVPFTVISQDFDIGERSILLDLNRKLKYPAPTETWNSSSSPCNWPEIKCSGTKVTGIVLRDKNITVQIPPIICDLKNLTVLDLSYNYIPGGFPTVLYNCSNLQYLDLSQNYFEGHIPIDVHRLSRDLRYLDIGANSFSGDVPKSIGGLSSLRVLNMYQNEFNGTFPVEIGDLPDLVELRMAYNDKFVPAKIPEEFSNLKKLKFLWVKQMNLIGEIPESVAENLSSLVHIDLAENNLTGAIPGGFFRLKNLTILYLFANRFSKFPSSISISALNLVELDLSINDLSGSIPEDIGKLKKLEVLHLNNNQLTGEVPNGIALISTLKEFRIFSNKLSGELPPEFGLYSNLEGFEVSENRFTGKLPENLCKGGVLQGVVVFSNNLSGEIPESIGNCRSMRTIQLYNNKFSGEIPKGVWTSFNLSSLMISENLFTGKLPEDLAWNLSRVEIAENRFSGDIPRGIGSWSSLKVFKASNNMLSGEIPVEITSLSGVMTLLLDGNQISGHLPTDVSGWSSLTTLDLSRNKLSGKIPSSIGSLPDLLNLDLSSNQFSGEIPSIIGDLRLTSLNLSSNHLSGKIPEAFDNLAYQNSFLNNSNLCLDNPVLNFPDCRSRFHAATRLSSKLLTLILVIAVVVFLITLISTLFLIRDYRKKNQKHNLATWKLTSFHKLEFTEANILSSLSEDNLIGSGGCGKVYKIPVDRTGYYVAVKRIWNSKKLDQNLEKEFLAEVEILGTIRHLNIVKLLCCISSEGSKILVYEYMENLSLDRWLHVKNKNGADNAVLDWPSRLNIAIGAAKGLCHMHHNCSPPIIHRDVKSSNILLDSEFNARIADFGLAKIMVKHDEPQTMSAVAGSFGYFAPEYAYTTKVTTSIDVYSFGVVLLELVTGREANNGDEYTNLAEWAWTLFQEETPIYDSFDEEIREQCYFEEITTVFKLGLMCTTSLPSNRPSMKDVLQILQRSSPSEGSYKADAVPRIGSYKGSKRVHDNDDCNV